MSPRRAEAFPPKMLRVHHAVMLLLCLILLYSRHARGSTNLTDRDIQALYERSLGSLRERMQASGIRLIKDCFMLEELERRHGKWKADQMPHILTMRPTLYGKGVNASSLGLVVQKFEQMLRSIAPPLGWVIGPVNVTAVSQFEEPDASLRACRANQQVDCCAFDLTQYRTVSMQLPEFATRQAHCWKLQSPKARLALETLHEEVMHELGFPDLHILGYLSNFLQEPHPYLKFMKAFQDPLPAKVLRVTLEIRGPCAVPFTIEKQTFLRVVLPVAMERDLNIYSVKVEAIQEMYGDGPASEKSARLTLILGVYEEIQSPPFSEAFNQATTSKDGVLPLLTQLLSDAGFIATEIVFVDATEIEGGPHDTIWSSWSWSIKRLQQEEERLRRRWSLLISSVFIGVLSIAAVLLSKKKEARTLEAKIEDLYIEPRRLLARSWSSKRSSSTINAVFSDTRRQWAEGIIDGVDVEFEKDDAGRTLLLGKGGSGQVYKGKYKGCSPVAIKVLEDVTRDTSEEIMKEIAILNACRHPHIVQFQGVAFTSGHVLLIMEYMDGGDLRRALNRGSEYRWRNKGPQVAYDIACALAYLHSHSVIHLDVKSANVLLTSDGRAKLCDVGITIWLTFLETHASLPGTPGTFPYMAPEVLVDGQASCSADIFSFGIILWEIVTGETPRRGCRREARVPEECSKEVAALIDQCCASNSKDRPTAVDIMVSLEEQIDHG
eukprot:jgi/Botrbrau1/6756/Bobra.0324s0041.1